MARVPIDVSAAHRARWLAELSEALNRAQDLIWQIAVAEVRDVCTLDLSARIEAAQAEVQSLRLGRLDKGSMELHPDWTDPVPWDWQAEQRA